MIRLATFLALMLTGCASAGGTGQPAAGAPTHKAHAGADATCEGYSPGDACMTDDTFARCQAAEARCPGKVKVLETCPLQFSCG